MESKVFPLLHSFSERKIKHMVPVPDFFNLLIISHFMFPSCLLQCMPSQCLCVPIVMPSDVILRPSINCPGSRLRLITFPEENLLQIGFFEGYLSSCIHSWTCRGIKIKFNTLPYTWCPASSFTNFELINTVKVKKPKA